MARWLKLDRSTIHLRFFYRLYYLLSVTVPQIGKGAQNAQVYYQSIICTSNQQKSDAYDKGNINAMKKKIPLSVCKQKKTDLLFCVQ